jgi:hypothetical protein
MKKNAMFFADLGYGLDRLNGPYFLIAVLDAHKKGFIGNRFFQLVDIDATFAVHVEGGRFETFLFEPLARMDDRDVFDLRKDHMVFSAAVCPGR